MTEPYVVPVGKPDWPTLSSYGTCFQEESANK